MLTKADIKWLSKLSGSEKVKIVPYNLKVKVVFEKQKKELLLVLGQNIEVLHKGATGLGISGQGEIDLFIPISLNRFDIIIDRLKKVYGPPKSINPNNRVRFNNKIDNIQIEIIIVNKDSEGWRKNVAFEEYLKSNSEALEQYRKLKEDSNGLSIRSYYTKKIEFINNLLREILPSKPKG